MKKIFTILGVIFSVAVFSQSGDAVVNALKEGNTDKFTGYLGNSVDVKLPQKSELKNVSRIEATSLIADFFSSNHISSFEVISQREMSGTMYIAGKLKGASESYNITVMLKNNGNDLAIITVRIS